ncbi:MAG: PTS IIA-like nitrogen regulatory protein PtsN [Halioglobus sp.]|nr:PTS IIA-like nitrogen regulatory protein PtsN [Halioglobus sp.]
MAALKDILTPARTSCQIAGVSKKRLFEIIAQVVCDDRSSLDYDDVLDQLTAREKLGSTGLGGGIAIPHCRVASCSEPLGALLSLAEPIPFEAPDEQPVDLLFVLLVPEEAHQEHLDILAEVARMFSDHDFCKALRAAPDSAALFNLAMSGPG